MLIYVTVSVTIHAGLGEAGLLLPGLGSAQGGKLSTMRVFPSIFLCVGAFWQTGFWEKAKDGNPCSTESAGAVGSHELQSLLHPGHQVSRERAELFTYKPPGTKPPPQGKGGEKKIKTERT